MDILDKPLTDTCYYRLAGCPNDTALFQLPIAIGNNTLFLADKAKGTHSTTLFHKTMLMNYNVIFLDLGYQYQKECKKLFDERINIVKCKVVKKKTSCVQIYMSFALR